MTGEEQEEAREEQEHEPEEQQEQFSRGENQPKSTVTTIYREVV